MHITRIEAEPIDLPLKKLFKISLGTMEVVKNVLVRIHTDDGLIGYGEASPVTFITGETQKGVLATLEYLRPALIGRDPLDIQGAVDLMDRLIVGNPSAKAAIDIALHDLSGKQCGQPLASILGGAWKDFTTDMTVGIQDPEEMAREAQLHVQNGFQAIKVKVGTDPDLDIKRVKAIRKAVGDRIELRLDANQGWRRKEAIRVIRALSDYGIALVEQPVAAGDIEGLGEVRRNVPVPIMADESAFSPADVIRLIRLEAVDMVNIKLMKAGGITRAGAINSICEAAGIRCFVGCMVESRVGFAAAAHLVAATSNIVMADLDSYLYLKSDAVHGGPYLDGERAVFEGGSGLGIINVTP